MTPSSRKLFSLKFLALLLLGIAIKCSDCQVRLEDPSHYNSYSRGDYFDLLKLNEDYNIKSTGKQMSSPSAGTAFVEDEYGNYAAASGGHGHGGHKHGGGGGGGWGWGWNGGGKKADCNSALGLLSVLGLASYLQGVLNRQTTTTTARPAGGGGRKKRSEEEEEADVNNLALTARVLPMLSAFGHARDGLVPHHCVQQPLCRANRILMDHLAEGQGQAVAVMISHAAAKFLNNGKDVRNPRDKLLQAAKTGRNRGNCSDYEYCKALDKLPTYAFPPGGKF